MELDNHFFSWINSHLNDNPAELRLKYARKHDLDYSSAITQIECRRKFGSKLGVTLARFPEFFFPSLLAGEQATSDLVSDWHSTLLKPGERLLDLTAGLGIDAFHAAGVVSKVTAVERDNDRASALIYNSRGLCEGNVDIVEGDCHSFVEEYALKGQRCDTVFIDPTRRSSDGSRVFALDDCEPNVLELMPVLAKICNRVIIKASPMLDISHTVGELGQHTALVAAVGTVTECKELLAIVDFDQTYAEPLIQAVTLSKEGRREVFEFYRSDEADAPMPSAKSVKAGDYIYEASPSMMKAGAWKTLAARYNLYSFHANTRLLHSDVHTGSFPGSCREVVEVLPYASRVIKRFASKYPRIDVATRNFGMSAESLRAKLNVNVGDNSLRLYGFTDDRGERILVVTKPIEM